jgi:hypothetical protein
MTKKRFMILGMALILLVSLNSLPLVKTKDPNTNNNVPQIVKEILNKVTEIQSSLTEGKTPRVVTGGQRCTVPMGEMKWITVYEPEVSRVYKITFTLHSPYFTDFIQISYFVGDSTSYMNVLESYSGETDTLTIQRACYGAPFTSFVLRVKATDAHYADVAYSYVVEYMPES